MTTIENQCAIAYEASRKLALVSSNDKNIVLRSMAESILKNNKYILEENSKDVSISESLGISKSLIDRLLLTEKRLKDIYESIMKIAELEDPIGEIISSWEIENGLKISKVRVPLGVIGVIYEARPNVTADTAALCLKTGNSVVLRGSSSAYNSNYAIVKILQHSLQGSKRISPKSIQLLEDTSREGVDLFVSQRKYLSVVIPRGSGKLIQRVVNSSKVPTIETGEGNCHVYIDKDADPNKAVPIIINSKVQRPSVCNACETILVHKDIADELLNLVLPKLNEANVEIRGDEYTCKLFSKTVPATEDDWKTEFLSLILAVRIVNSIDDAIEHIHKYGTRHTEAIVSENSSAINKFKQSVDASTVLINASTRFTDGGQFGFGAEIGISTQKLHARGPMGLREITTYKYIVEGTGQIRE